MRKRKISLLVVSQDSSAMGGAEVLLTFLAKEFTKKDVDVSVLTNCRPFLDAQEKVVTAVYVPFRLDIIGNIRGFIKFIFQLIPAIFWYGKIIWAYSKKENGLVLISGFSEKLVVTPLAKAFNLPVLWLEHGPLEELFKRNLGIPGLLYKLAEKCVPMIITPSENTKKHIIKEAKISKKKIKVIHNGIELKSGEEIMDIKKSTVQLKNKINEDNKHFLVGMISRLQKEKGQDTAIEAMDVLCKRHNNIKLIVVGEGSDLDKYKKYASKYQLDKKIQFTGYVSDKKKWQLYSLFDIFLFPTRWDLEGFGIVLLEAMMMGVPIVASDVGPVPEVVGNAGIIVSPDKDNVASAIEKVKMDKRLRSELIDKGKDRVCDFDIRKTAGKYLRVFEDVLVLNAKSK